MHDGTALWLQVEISRFCGSINLILFKDILADVTNPIGVSLTREDGKSRYPCKYTQFSISDKVTKTLSANADYSQDHCCSLAFSIVGFLAGIFATEFGLPLSARIGCRLALVVGTSLTIPLMMASFGPGLI